MSVGQGIQDLKAYLISYILKLAHNLINIVPIHNTSKLNVEALLRKNIRVTKKSLHSAKLSSWRTWQYQ